MFNVGIFNILTYGFLYLTVISIWLPKLHKIHLWWVFLFTSSMFGLLNHSIDIFAIPIVFLLALCCFFLKKQHEYYFLKVFSAIVLLILSLALMAHIVPWFHNLKVLDHVLISKNGIPFTMYLNFDKTLVGIFIVGILLTKIRKKSEWLTMAKTTFPKSLLIIAIVASLGLIMKFVSFDPKFPNSFFIWSITNLLFVCLAEEALFRGFIQEYLCKILQKIPWGNVIAIIIASVLFGVAHYAGGIKYILLATIAGIGYGWVYFQTKRIEASILTHFSLNLVHFLFFTYPALATSYF